MSDKKDCGSKCKESCSTEKEFKCDPSCCSNDCAEYIKGLEEKITKYEEDNIKQQQNNEKLLTTAAELSNQVKRLESQLSFVKEDSIKKFAFEVLKSFDLINYAKNQIKDVNVIDGLNVMEKDLNKIFQKFGIEEVQTLNFDANVHEVISILEGPDAIEVIEKGYMLNKILLKPAKLVLYKSQ